MEQGEPDNEIIVVSSDDDILGMVIFANCVN